MERGGRDPKHDRNPGCQAEDREEVIAANSAFWTGTTRTPPRAIGGGNAFLLLNDLYRWVLLDVIRDRVRHGLPYLGVSAMTNVACPAIKTTNDRPIVQPPSLDALSLIPFQGNPCYFTGQTFMKVDHRSFQEHFGETRDDRLRELHEMNDTSVVGLWKGGLLRVERGRILLVGAPARVFRKGQEPADVAPRSLLEDMLEAPAG